MRNKELETVIHCFLEEAYNLTDSKKWQIQCYEPGLNSDVATIDTLQGYVGDLVFVKWLIEDWINYDEINKEDVKFCSMYDLNGPCRHEKDKEWIIQIRILTESALSKFKTALTEALKKVKSEKSRQKDIEAKLNTLYNKEFEVNQPYEGKKGKHVAEIFCTNGDAQEIIHLFRTLRLEDDIIADDCSTKRGLVQVIIKTETALRKFKHAIDKKFERTTNEKHADNMSPFFVQKKQNTSSEQNNSVCSTINPNCG